MIDIFTLLIILVSISSIAYVIGYVIEDIKYFGKVRFITFAYALRDIMTTVLALFWYYIIFKIIVGKYKSSSSTLLLQLGNVINWNYMILFTIVTLGVLLIFYLAFIKDYDTEAFVTASVITCILIAMYPTVLPVFIVFSILAIIITTISFFILRDVFTIVRKGKGMVKKR